LKIYSKNYLFVTIQTWQEIPVKRELPRKLYRGMQWNEIDPRKRHAFQYFKPSAWLMLMRNTCKLILNRLFA